MQTYSGQGTPQMTVLSCVVTETNTGGTSGLGSSSPQAGSNDAQSSKEPRRTLTLSQEAEGRRHLTGGRVSVERSRGARS
jgi:hypothetical protein